MSALIPLMAWQVRWGCYWNRDILRMVDESGLTVHDPHYTNDAPLNPLMTSLITLMTWQVLDVQRRHMGTTYLVRCSPRGRAPEAAGPAAAAARGPPIQGPPQRPQPAPA